MRHLFISVLFACFVSTSYSQIKPTNCNCPKNPYAGTKPDAIFRLKNGKSFSLCGNKDTIEHQIYFSEFVLSPCGGNKIIGFWGAVETCRVKAIGDTLFVETLSNLPTGRQMKYTETICSIERIYYANGAIKHTLDVNRNFPRYTKVQIAHVLKLYQDAPVTLNDSAMEIADKLFVSAISGSKQARSYLTNFSKFKKQLDGAFGEQYDDLMAMLGLWDDMHRDPGLSKEDRPYSQ